MKLLTKEIEAKLLQKSLLDADEEGSNAKVIAKFFNPLGKERWFVTGGDKLPDGDWMFYGLVYLLEWEIGTFLLSELENITLNYNLKIERDILYKGNETLEEAYRKEVD